MRAAAARTAPAAAPGAPAAMHSLYGALGRCRHLLALGARELAGDAQVIKAVQVGRGGGVGGGARAGAGCPGLGLCGAS